MAGVDDKVRASLEPVTTIWVPVAGRGPTDGFRYRDTFRALDVPEIVQAYGSARAAVERYAAGGSDTELGEWAGHCPALSVYAMWAVLALEGHQILDGGETRARLKLLADLQKMVHRGRSAGWLAPPWWGSEVHATHRAMLIAAEPGRYSASAFAQGSL